MRASPPLVNQTKGMLLEEVILLLLKRSGYRPVQAPNGDPTLGTCTAGLQVKGRGGAHQIDAVADFTVVPPFTYPQRLLVEGKCYSKKSTIELDIVRNALGVFKDVSEFWTGLSGGGPVNRRRYHYQYAIFATCDFTQPSQAFAFAHDIHLFPLARSAFFQPIIPAIEAAARAIAPRLASSKKTAAPVANRPSLSEVRRMARQALALEALAEGDDVVSAALTGLREVCTQVGAGYVAMAGGVFPILLIPENQRTVDTLDTNTWVRVRYNGSGWYIEDPERRRRLFSFDLPTQLFDLYAESGALSRAAAADLKENFLSELQFVVLKDHLPRLVTLKMDTEWLASLRQGRR